MTLTTIDQVLMSSDETDTLDSDKESLVLLIRQAVGKLGSQSEEATRILKNVKAENSARYLVGALDTSDFADDERLQDTIRNAIEVLKQYGASNATVRPLVAALGNDHQRNYSMQVLKHYGASETTLGPLVGALGDPNVKKRAAAAEILIHYGKDVLEYIRMPKSSSPAYQAIAMVTKILKQA